MGEEKQKEYVMLREAIVRQMQEQQKNSTFAITATITLIGFGLQMDSSIPEFFLLPYIILLLFSLKIHNYKSEIQRTVGYIMCVHEKRDGFYWETALNQYREHGKYNHKNKLIRWLETQELTLMGIICLVLYVVMFLQSEYHEDLIRMFIFILIASMVLIILAIISVDYWNFKPLNIKDYADDWKRVLNDCNSDEN